MNICRVCVRARPYHEFMHWRPGVVVDDEADGIKLGGPVAAIYSEGPIRAGIG